MDIVNDSKLDVLIEHLNSEINKDYYSLAPKNLYSRDSVKSVKYYKRNIEFEINSEKFWKAEADNIKKILDQTKELAFEKELSLLKVENFNDAYMLHSYISDLISKAEIVYKNCICEQNRAIWANNGYDSKLYWEINKLREINKAKRLKKSSLWKRLFG
jgi:hypothetical protein